MTEKSWPEGDADTESVSAPFDEPVKNSDESTEEWDESVDKPSYPMATTLGARAAFQLDPGTLAAFQEQFAALPSFQPEMRALTDSFAQMALPPETLANIQDTLATAIGRFTLPPETFANFQGALAAASERFTVPDEFWEQFKDTTRILSESVSIPSLYSADQLALRNREQRTEPRPARSAEAFFDEHAVDVTDVKSLLKALSVIQEKHHLHRPVWRGQQDVSWPVHSSLYRKLEALGQPMEDLLVSAEMTAMQHAGRWGQDTTPALNFFADLQHYGAPTRLLDATLDPEIAAWFATEADPALDEKDGRVIAWGRSVRISARKVSKENDDLPARDDAPFWHSWTTDEERGRVGWGTGSRTWSWFPPALSDRMRAQRAGFLLEAGPLVTPTVAEVLSAGVTRDWRVAEITRATSIVGLPSRHDVVTKPNSAHLVPIFSLRIAARAKPAIRKYLSGKGLSFSTVYPDRGGLVSYLRGPFGLSS